MPRFKFGEWFAILFVVTIVYVLVRPNSKAADFIGAVGSFAKAVVAQATDTAK